VLAGRGVLVPTVLRLLDARDPGKVLAEETGRPLEAWRDRWLRALATAVRARHPSGRESRR
jgi:hypothetical protein